MQFKINTNSKTKKMISSIPKIKIRFVDHKIIL